MQTCKQYKRNTELDEWKLCGKPARHTAHMPSGKDIPMCAECYDKMMGFWKSKVEFSPYDGEQEKYRKALRMNRELWINTI